METKVPGLPKIELSAKDYAELFALTKWYGQMPETFDTCDCFHDRVSDYKMSFLPEFPTEADDEGWYCSHIEINVNGELVAAFDCEDQTVVACDDTFVYVPFVIKEE